MKKDKKRRFRGVQRKIFLLTVGLVVTAIVSAAVVGLIRLKSLARLTIDSSREQNQLIMDRSTDSIVDLAKETMMRAVDLACTVVDTEFWIYDHDFSVLAAQVKDVFLHPENYGEKEVEPPKKENDGKLTLQLLMAEDTDPNDPVMNAMTGKLANLAPAMEEIVRGNLGFLMDCYIALPDGRTLAMDDMSGGKFQEDGTIKPYDPRTRPWYQGAVEKGSLYFTPAVYSYFYDKTEIVWGMPVYVDGDLVAVLEGSLNLAMAPAAIENLEFGKNGFTIIVSNEGQLVYSPRTEGELAMRDGLSHDIREQIGEPLEEVIDMALDQNKDFVTTEVDGKEYFAAFAPIETLGWTIIMFSPCEELLSETFAVMDDVDEITERTLAGYTDTFTASLLQTLLVAVILIAVSVILALLFSGRLVKPINRMTDRVKEITGDNLYFEMEKIYHTGDEIEVLAEAFSGLSERTRNYIGKITDITAEKEKLGAELNVAAQIQQDMLPRIFPLYPERKDFEVYASMDPAKEVGGDFYDIFLIDEDHLALVMADVSGKGIPASLFMVISKTLIKNRTMMGGTPAEIVTDVNMHLCDGNRASMFVTVWLAIVTLSTGEVVEANAGHENPFLLQKKDAEEEGEYEELVRPHDFVLGGLKKASFEEDSFRLNPGDRIFIYTDGLPEATNAKGERFEMDRVTETINRHKNLEMKDMLSEIRKDVDAFVGDAPQFDDLTMLAFTYHGPKPPVDAKNRSFPANRDSYPEILTFVNEALENVPCESKSRRQIDMAVDEIFTNIADYAYGDGEGDVMLMIGFSEDKKEMELTFIDSGAPYDPLAKEDPDVNLPGNKRKIGGLGIFLVKNIMDEMRYEYRDGNNMLTIRKRLV